MTCPSCGHEAPQGSKFCNECGARIAGAVPAPAAEDRHPRDYTPPHLAEKILQSKSALEGERKQVTVLFADVKGSMELAQQVDPEEWHAILDRFFQILSGGVHRFEGTVNQYTGDGIMALFGAPIAHEDHAQRACYAALQLCGELRSYSEELKRTHALALSVRMGLNSGEVVVGKIGDDLRMDYTAQGHTVGLAQRIEQLATPGTAYLTEHTARLVEGFFQLRDLREFDLKGAQAPVRVFELEGPGPLRTRLDLSRARGFSKFVGRAEEMAALEAALAQSLGGRGQVVGVVAEAGVGKSRLCFEFLERCRARGLSALEAHGQAHGRSIPFLPILQLFRAFFGIEERDAPATAREKIAGRLLLLDEAYREILPLVFDFMGVSDPERPAPGMDPDVRQRRLHGLVRRVVEARGGRETPVTLLEDLHWFDAGSDAFVAAIAEAVPATGGLLLANFRPEYRARWMESSGYRELPLVPLGDAQIEDLLGDLLGDDPSVAALPGPIRERTAGNPFFVEEVVQSLVESRVLRGERGAYRLEGSLENLEIPARVQSVIAARIDRLPELEKQVLQAAAVIGRNFEESLLRRIAPLSDGELEAALAALQQAEFVREVSLYPDAQYAFKHPLTQEVALHSQLQDRRRRIHEAAATAIEEMRSERLDENAALLAHHWEAASQPLAAARWLARAAAWVGRSDRRAGHTHWRRTRELLRGVPASPESTLLGVTACGQLVRSGWALGSSEEEVEALFAEGVRLAEGLEDRRPLAQLWLGYASYAGLRRGAQEFVRAAGTAYEIAVDLDESDLLLAVRASLGTALGFAGRSAEALELLERAVADPPEDLLQGWDRLGFSPYIYAVLWRGQPLLSLGRMAEARAAIERGLELAREHGDIESTALALDTSIDLMDSAGDDPAAALAAAQRLHELAQRLGTPSYRVTAEACLGIAHLMAGSWDEAIECFERSRRMIRDEGVVEIALSSALSGLTRAHTGRGEVEKAVAYGRRAVEAAAAQATPNREIRSLAWLARALLAGRDASATKEIEALVERAEALAQQTGARLERPALLEIRAQLARSRGQPEEAERQLGEAQRLYAEMGATGHAARLIRELAR